MKNFLILVAMLLSAVAFTVYATPPPGEQARDIPIVFTPPIPVTDQVFDVSIEKTLPKAKRHSFTFGQHLTNRLNKRNTTNRQPPLIVPLS